MRGNEEDEEDNAEVDNQLLDESVVPAKPECLTQPDTLVNLAEQDLLKLAEHDLAQCERLIDERESELKDTELSLLEVANVSMAMDRLCTELEKSTAIAIGLVESRRASAVNTKRDELLRMDLTDSKDKDKQSRGGSSFDPGYGSTLLLLGGVVLCVWLFGK